MYRADVASVAVLAVLAVASVSLNVVATLLVCTGLVGWAAAVADNAAGAAMAATANAGTLRARAILDVYLRFSIRSDDKVNLWSGAFGTRSTSTRGTTWPMAVRQRHADATQAQGAGITLSNSSHTRGAVVPLLCRTLPA